MVFKNNVNYIQNEEKSTEENSSIDSEPALGKHQDFSWGEIQLPDKF